MLITMFTDISVRRELGLGAYAVWAKVNGNTVRHAAVFKNPIHDSNVAEVWGIINGLHVVIKHINPPDGSKIIAESDSETAIGVLKGYIQNPIFNGLAGRAEAVLNGRHIRVVYIHVKGHTGFQTPRHAVNRWCDRACREVLRAHQNRNEISTEA